MDIGAAREAIAAGLTATGLVHGYPRPVGSITKLPAAIVLDPGPHQFHTAVARRHTSQIVVRVMVSRTAEQDTTKLLDDLVSFDQLPAAIEAIDSGEWVSLTVTGTRGEYVEVVQGGKTIGLGCDLICAAVFQ